MPHAVFNLGIQAATIDLAGRSLIPGVEPGGSRAGQETKPALLIRDAWVEPIQINFDAVALHSLNVYLKLSQETDLTPGLILPIGAHASENVQATAVAVYHNNFTWLDLFRARGTVWAPRVVGIRLVIAGFSGVDLDVHLDYEAVDVPWMDWFMKWDHLDNVVDNDKEY